MHDFIRLEMREMLPGPAHIASKIERTLRIDLEPGQRGAKLAREGSVSWCFQRHAISMAALIERGRGPLHVLRYGEIPDAHLAQTVVDIGDERLGNPPTERFPRYALAVETVEHKEKMQHDCRGAPFRCVRDTSISEKARLARLCHDRAIKLLCCAPVSSSSVEPGEHAVFDPFECDG